VFPQAQDGRAACQKVLANRDGGHRMMANRGSTSSGREGWAKTG
jgi:hypothetical protein